MSSLYNVLRQRHAFSKVELTSTEVMVGRSCPRQGETLNFIVTNIQEHLN